MKQRIICLVGASGSGKSTLARSLSSHFRIPCIDAGEVVRELFRSEGGQNEASLIDYANDKLLKSHGEYFVSKIKDRADKIDADVVLIVGIRTAEELIYLSNNFDVLDVIHIRTGVVRRIFRKVLSSKETFFYIIRREVVEAIWGQHRTFGHATHRIDGSAPPSTIFEAVSARLSKLQGLNHDLSDSRT